MKGLYAVFRNLGLMASGGDPGKFELYIVVPPGSYAATAGPWEYDREGAQLQEGEIAPIIFQYIVEVDVLPFMMGEHAGQKGTA
jgi:hypothetical protein